MSPTQSHSGGPPKFGVPLGSASKAHQKGLKNADTHNIICAMLCCFRKARRKYPGSLRQNGLDLCWPMCPVFVCLASNVWTCFGQSAQEVRLVCLCSPHVNPKRSSRTNLPQLDRFPQSVRQLSRFRVVNITSGPVQSGVPVWWGDVEVGNATDPV